MKRSENERCKDCAYWGELLGSTTYRPCRRHAPTLQPRDETQGNWPYTTATDWCGEFEAAK